MATSIAAVIAAKERRIVERFRDVGATSVEQARTVQDVGISENVGFRRLRRHEVVREANPGFYYLDEAVWIAVRRTRRRLALSLIAIILVIGLGAALGVFSSK